MKSLDVLYTPLDTPEVPDFDVSCLLEWIATHSESQEIPNRIDASKITRISKSYPWKIIYPRHNYAWQFNFDKEFPQLAEYFYKAFDMTENDLFGVLFLPVRNDFAGLGLWHSDPDEYGLRIYLENNETENFLQIKPTIFPYESRPAFSRNLDYKNIPLQDKILSASLRKSRQTFYLNNVRAVHAVNVSNPGTVRLAVILSTLNQNLKQQFNDLVVRSAEKYKDLAIFWEPQA